MHLRCFFVAALLLLWLLLLLLLRTKFRVKFFCIKRNINDSNINDIQSLLAKNQKRKSMASMHLVRSNSRSNSNSNSKEATKKQRRCMAVGASNEEATKMHGLPSSE